MEGDEPKLPAVRSIAWLDDWSEHTFELDAFDRLGISP